MLTRQAIRRGQEGAMLLEALIAILIFSMGILALIGLQGVAIKQTSDAKYRADAAFLASQIISQMWADNPANIPTYAHYATITNANTCTFGGSASGNGNVTAWIGSAGTNGTVVGNLPGATSARQHISIAAGNLVTVQVCWQQPGTTDWSRHVVTAQING